jgi:hypothetical protein
MVPRERKTRQSCPQAVDRIRTCGEDLAMATEHDLTPGERELLQAAEDDDIDVGWACIYLGVRANGGPGPTRATPDEIDACFDSLSRLHDLGLINVGRIEFLEEASPGRLPPFHVSEPIDLVKQRVMDVATNATEPWEWQFSAWIVLKDTGT